MTAISDVAIGNRALSKLGEARVTSFGDNSKAARALTACYDIVRDAELRRHNWHFAKSRAELAALSSAPAFGYGYAYQLPADCLKVISVGDYQPGVDTTGGTRSLHDAADYAIEGRTLLTDYGAPLKLRYLRRVTDPAQFDSAFIEALAARLAVEMANELADSASRKQDAKEDYRQAILEAIAANAIETPPQPLPDDSWLLSREA